MKTPLLALVIVLAVLTACPETPTDSAADAVRTRKHATRNVNEARANVFQSEALMKTAHANFDVSRTAADGRHSIAKE